VKAYRICHIVDGAAIGQPGHPLYVRPEWQGAGRFDQPALYTVLYFALSQSGAVAEVYGNLSEWTDAMFLHPTRGRASLISVDIDDELAGRLLDLDDARVLLDRGLRPTDVVGRSRLKTRTLAADLFSDGVPGIRFWSYYRCEWSNVAVFNRAHETAALIRVDNTEPMSLDIPCVRAGSEMLCRPIRKPRSTASP
jgi:hypothetical protein